MSGKTKLARQLTGLQTPQTSLHIQRRIKESFLYDTKQAATIDQDTHYSIALSGLNELISIDTSFNDFKSTLFKETSKSLDRSTLSRSESDDLNEEIVHFLYKVISPYFLMNATHKVIEWLIVKYNIHTFNTSDLIIAILPYHETRFFTRIVQICDLKSNFPWLEHIKKTGSILVKTILHNYLYKNTDLLRIFSKRLIENHQLNYDTTQWTSFLTSTIISMLDKNGLDENLLIFILSYMNDCFKMSTSSLTISAYLILTFLSTKAHLNDVKLKKILKRMTANFKELTCKKPRNEFVYCLSTICLHQNLDNLPNQLVDLLLEDGLYEECDIKLPFLLSCIINNLITRLDDENRQTVLKLLSTIKPNKNVIDSMMRKIVDHCDRDEEMFRNCTELMKMIEKRYPNQFDESIENLDQNNVSKILHSNLYLKLEDGNIKLINAINHPNIKIRIASLDLLKNFENYDLLDSTSKEIIYNAIKSMFLDQNRKLLNRLLDVDFLDKILSKNDLVKFSNSLFANCDDKISKNNSKSDVWIKIRTKFLNLLLKFNDYNDDQFLSIFSRFIFPVTDNDLELFYKLIELPSISKINFIQYLASKFKSTKSTDLNSTIESIFNETANYVLLNGNSLIDSLISEKSNVFNLICALIINFNVLNNLKNCTKFDDKIFYCTNRSIQILNSLLIDGNKINDQFKFIFLKDANNNENDDIEQSSIYTFHNQLQIINKNQLSIDFIKLIISELITSIAYGDDFCSILTLMCNLINRSTDFSSMFNQLIEYESFNEHLISMWIKRDQPIYQARSLAICSQKMKNQNLSSKTTLHLFIALSSPSIDIRKLAIDLLLNVNLNSNDLISLAVKNSNEFQISDHAISRVLTQADHKKRKQFLNLVNNHLINYTDSFDLTIGLLNLLHDDFTKELVETLSKIALELLDKKSTISPKEFEILALIFRLYINFFSDEKIFKKIDQHSRPIYNYKLVIENFCKMIQYDQMDFREFVYANLKKRWILRLKSKTLIASLIDTLLHDFITTGNDKTKSKLINFINDGEIVSWLINEKYTKVRNNSSSNQLADSNQNSLQQQIKRQTIEMRLPFNVDNIKWRKVLILLEITQSKNEIKNPTSLFECVLKILDCLKVNDEQPSIEYLKQLILHNIHSCIVQADCDFQNFKIYIDLLFNLMKSLRLKASQIALLNILNLITPHFKKEILKHFISIFTFIGTNMMDFNSEYEMRLIDDTLEIIIPCLLEENEQMKDKITNSFIDAFEDIPSHRLVHIFSKLIELYKEDDLKKDDSEDNSLWFVLFKLDLRAIQGHLFGETEFLDFTQSLISLFDCNVNLITMVRIIVRTIQLVEMFKKIGNIKIKFGNDEVSRKESFKLNLLLIKQLNIILESDQFINQISIVDWNEINLNFINLVEQLISLIIKLEEMSDKNESQEQLLIIAYDALNKVNNLLPLEEFSDIIQWLMENGENKLILQKTLKIFIKKLTTMKTEYKISDQCWMNLFASLKKIIEQCPNEQDKEQTLLNGQYAFVVLKMIAKNVEHNPQLRAELNGIIDVTLKITKEIDIEKPKLFNLFVSGVLCLGKLVCVIEYNQAKFYISSIVQLILKAFKQRNTDLVNLSCFAVLAKLTKLFPTYLIAFLPDILIKICTLIKRREKLSELNVKLLVVEKNIIDLIDFRKLIEILLITYKQIEIDNHDYLIYFLKFTEIAFKSLKLNVIEENMAAINELIFKMSDYRSNHHKQISEDKLNKLENHSITIICSFLPKLKVPNKNEESNRHRGSEFESFIRHLNDWAIESKSNQRLQFFYKLTNRLADCVKVLFPIIVTPIIAPNCIKMLSKEFADDQTIDLKDKHTIVLNVLQTISKSIHHNVDSLISSKDIESFVDLIVDQIDYDYGTDEMYVERIKDGVSNCVQDLVRHFNDFNLIKNLQIKILTKTKQKNKTKKYNALFVLHQFILSNTEDYVTYLSDAIPYLIELYEDDSENIQVLLVNIFRDIEQLINEPISNYI